MISKQFRGAPAVRAAMTDRVSMTASTALTVSAVLVSWGAGVASLAVIGAPIAAATEQSHAVNSPQVVVKNFMFAPTSLKVKAGSTVIWTNKDEEPHTVVSIAGLFRSGAMDTNESFSFKFDKPGTYQFLCSIHPQMVGTIVVE